MYINQNSKENITIGIISDLHISLSDSAKLLMTIKENRNIIPHLDMLVNLGDTLGDTSTKIERKQILTNISEIKTLLDCKVEHLLGNHDLDYFSKDEVAKLLSNTPTTKYRSYNISDVRLFFLDFNYNTNGEEYNHGNFHWSEASIPKLELQWFERKLKEADKTINIIFCHQNIKKLSSIDAPVEIVNNDDILRILTNKNIRYIIQGHTHIASEIEYNKIPIKTLSSSWNGENIEIILLNIAYDRKISFDTLIL